MQTNTDVELFLVSSIHSVCYRHADEMHEVAVMGIAKRG